MLAEEQLDAGALSAYLGSVVSIEQIPGGHSNLTYLLKLNGVEYVLRRPPLGPVPPKAHDMVREFRVLQAVHPEFPLAPKPERLCEDVSVIGAPFYLMERRRGIVIRQENPLDLSLRRSVGEAVLDTLVQLHAVDARRAPIGRPAGFLERQLTGWFGRWQNARTRELPAMDRIMEWLISRLPNSSVVVVLHNDFKLDNLMLDPANPARVEAVLDWEMAALGDPLIDLGILLCYWRESGGAGWPTRVELIERYAAATGRDVSRIDYYEVFAIFKLAVVLQQIFHRYHVGQTHDSRFAALEQRVLGLINVAAELI